MTASRHGLRLFRAQRERGATAVLTGLLMVGLVGFTGLAVDGGATYAKHQELQNGADAAALAAAQECAADENDCNEANLQTEVAPYGEANVRNDKETVSTSFDIDLSAQTVTATVTGTKFHWFLPVVGVSESELSPDATATWGSPNSGPAMLPLVISQCEFEGALGEPILGTILDIYMPKNGQDAECSWGSNYPPGGFGWLSQDVCEVTVTVGEWVDGDTGVDEPESCDWASFIGQVVLVPIFDDYTGNGSDGQFHIARFAALEVLGIQPKNGATSLEGDACTTEPDPQEKYHQICVRGMFIEYVSTADDYQVGGPDTEVSVVSLID
jgi:Flp pilus assembly protein TadG